MRKIIILIIFTIVFIPVKAQEMLGIVNSNYAGSVGSIINPSSIVNSKLFMDINLVTADIFAQNNYLYIYGEDYKLFQFLKRDPEFQRMAKIIRHLIIILMKNLNMGYQI
jgi:hypothetical protein